MKLKQFKINLSIRNTLKSLLLGVAILFTIQALGIPENNCHEFYLEANITDRYIKYSQRVRIGHLGLHVSSFLESEFLGLDQSFKKEVKHFTLKGTDNNLTSDLSAFGISIQTLERKLEDIESLLVPSKLKKIFSSEDKRNKKIDEKIDDFISCRMNMEQCAADLKVILKQSDETIVSLNLIIEQINKKNAELEELETFIRHNEQGNTTLDSAIIVINQKKDILTAYLTTAKTVLKTHSDVMTAAITNINSLPIFYQKLKESVHRGIPGRILEARELKEEKIPVEEKNKKVSKEIALILEYLKLDIDDRAKIGGLFDKITNLEHLDGDEAYAILTAMPKNVDWGKKNSYNLPFNKELKRWSGADWDEFVSFETFITYEVATKTIPSKNNAKLIALVSELLEKQKLINGTPKRQVYVNAITTIISNLSIRLFHH